MTRFSKTERLAINQRHPKKPVLMWGCYLGNSLIYESEHYSFCKNYKTTYNPKLKIKPVK